MKVILFLGLFYGIPLLALLIIGIISWKYFDQRMHTQKVIPEGFVKTDEVFIDPTTSKTLRVYYNESTGTRIHIEE